MKQSDKAKIDQFNHELERDREMKMKLRDADWHFLAFKGATTAIHMRCPSRAHLVQLTPAEAISQGCPICEKMDAPPTTVTVSQLKAEVELPAAEWLKSILKSRRKMGRGNAPNYWTAS